MVLRLRQVTPAADDSGAEQVAGLREDFADIASFQGTYTAQWGYLMAAAAVVLAPVIILFAFAQRYFVEGITLTGLKG